jgi:hypothetical protein
MAGNSRKEGDMPDGSPPEKKLVECGEAWTGGQVSAPTQPGRQRLPDQIAQAMVPVHFFHEDNGREKPLVLRCDFRWRK